MGYTENEMALPTIPTSFAPHPTMSAPSRRPGTDFSSTFGFIGYFILGFVFLLALGVFFYGRILAATQVSRDAALLKAEKAIDPAAIEGFVQLRNRLNASQTLLANHTAFSGFLSSLGKLLPSGVRFISLHISIDSAGVARVEGTGTARSFNALAAASTAFATDGRIRDVIFSNISVNKDSSVSFGLSATLDPKIITFAP